MFRVFNCLTTEHDWRLVALAVIVCFLASLTAVSLLHRAQQTTGRVRAMWVAIAGVVTGCGIWATHFIAMLAYDPGIAVSYAVGLTVASLIVAVSITAVGLTVVVYLPAWWSFILGGGIVGAGVASMHYLGMAALQLPGQIGWAPDLILVSILLGAAFGTFALAAAVRGQRTATTLLAAVLLAIAIVALHFTAMGAVNIIPDPTIAIDTPSISPKTLALVLANTALAILGLSLAGAFADHRLRERDRRLATAVNNMSQGLVMFDSAERLVVCNDRYIEMYGLSRDVIKPGCTLRDVICNRIDAGSLDRGAEEYRNELLEAMARGETISWIVMTKGGRAISVVNRPIAGGDWVGVHEDITERRNAEQELKQTKAFLDTVIESAPVTISVKELPSFRYVLINRRAEQHYGISRESMIGRLASEVFPEKTAAFIEENDRISVRSASEIFFESHAISTPNGNDLIVTSRRVPLMGPDGKPQYLLTIVEDVTERKRAEARIAYLAHHDSLTNLPNRAAFNEHLTNTLEQAAAGKTSFAVLCIDLDRFKEVNDVFGHSVGDALLKEAATRMRAVAGDAFVARPGGDEFTVIMAGGSQPTAAEVLAERLLASAAEDIVIDGHFLRFGLSIGVAIYPTDGLDAKALLANADAALYRAKQDGRGSICFFAADMDRQLRDRRALQHDLRSAVNRQELCLHYQPQASINGPIVGFEALARWRHPSRGMVSPGTFIPIAEESGLIIPLGEWVLREACREAASWGRPLKIAVNLSPVQFKHGDLAGAVHAILLETGLAPSRLELEITEGVLIDDFSRAVSILHRLKTLGVRIAMDDFGTGYSSLSNLQSFPFDKMKIDKSFIANLGRNPQSAAIIRAMLGLGRGLGLPIMAEGVETQEQLEFLKKERCDAVQGFLIGRPAPIDLYADTVGRPAAKHSPVALAG
jgi:diguanylate cyclase (GGDEF)-like protein/PAS domain S-box-containing protein